jgi:hypothetical protein
LVDRKAVSQVEFEIGQVDSLLENYAELLEQVKQGEPSLIEVTAVASVLHSFYNGMENIFLSIAKEIDGDVPTGAQWHRELLARMSKATPARQAVLKETLVRRLADYLAFRHFFRHSYSFSLEWGELERLVVPLLEVWQQTRTEFLAFIGELIPKSQTGT